MFGPDPIDFFDPAPYAALAYYGHFLVGTIALLAAFIAFGVKKGKGLHKQAGLTFMFACLALTLTNISMLAEAFVPPLMVAAVYTVCAMGGAYLALQKDSLSVRTSEYALFGIQIAALIWFLSIAIPEVQSGRIPPVAPIIIAIIPLILLAGDVNWFVNHANRSRLRIARHLSRMIWAFVLVLRAPLVEFAAAGMPVSTPVVVIGPIVLAVVMQWYFQRKYVGSPFGKTTV